MIHVNVFASVTLEDVYEIRIWMRLLFALGTVRTSLTERSITSAELSDTILLPHWPKFY